MRVFAIVPFLFATMVTAAPTITSVTPSVGFAYAATRVTVHGTDLKSSSTNCPAPVPAESGGGTCVELFFGNVKAQILSVSATNIEALVIPTDTGTPRAPFSVVDVRVAVLGKGEATLPAGFTFDVAPFDPSNYTAVLVPITPEGEVHGANGSIWGTELRLFNDNPFAIQLDGPLYCDDIILGCYPAPFEAFSTRSVPAFRRDETVDGAFLWIPNPAVDGVHFSLRVRDVSQNAQSWGTSIPVVSRSDFGNHVTIIDVPTDPRYRGMLRVYSASPAPQSVQVRIFNEHDHRTPVVERTVDLSGILNPVFDPTPDHPAYAQIDLLTPEVRAAGDVVRVEIDNLGDVVSPPPPGIWGFVSVTNNESQQITTMLPQR
jgi:hypothetical protein